MKAEHQNLFWCYVDLLFLSLSFLSFALSLFCLCQFLTVTVLFSFSLSSCVFFLFLIQIEEFSSGFWEGTKLACWMKGENPWRFFPKLSIYLRATNTSESFRVTILPQVPGTYIII